MHKLVNFNFDVLVKEGEYTLETEYISLLEDKIMKDGFRIDEGKELVILQKDGNDWQVETMSAKREPEGVIFWVKPREVKTKEIVNKTYQYKDLVKIKSKIFGYSF